MLIAVQSPLVPWQLYLKDTQSNTKQHGRSFKLTTNRQKRNTNCKLFAWEKYNDHLNMICPVQVNMSRRISGALHPTWKKIINLNVLSVIGLFVCLKCLLTEHFNIISPIICSHRTEGLVWKKKSRGTCQNHHFWIIISSSVPNMLWGGQKTSTILMVQGPSTRNG